jgi:peptidoglycan/xylan/chitin deacetylase (PgdA/CDA1 family)
LAAHGLAATFFIATGFLDGGWMWNDRIIEACRQTSCLNATLPTLGSETMDLGTEQHRVATAHAVIDKAKYLPFDQRSAMVAQFEERLEVRPERGPMLDAEGVRRLRNMGMTIGAHTVAHPILAQLDGRPARTQIQQSRTYLIELLP